MKFKTFYLALALVAISLAATNAHALFGFGKYESVDVKNGMVSIPVTDVNDGEAHYYSMDVNGTDVKFFLLKSSDGVIRAAFDACDVCFREKKGYTQDGEFMVCNNCGQRFHSSRINEVKGGCNPSPLARTSDGQTVSILASDIISGRGYF